MHQIQQHECKFSIVQWGIQTGGGGGATNVHPPSPVQGPKCKKLPNFGPKYALKSLEALDCKIFLGSMPLDPSRAEGTGCGVYNFDKSALPPPNPRLSIPESATVVHPLKYVERILVNVLFCTTLFMLKLTLILKMAWITASSVHEN